MAIYGIFLVWQIGLVVAMMICLTSLKGEVTRHDINNIFLPIGPDISRLDKNIKLVKAIRWIYFTFIVGFFVLFAYELIIDVIK